MRFLCPKCKAKYQIADEKLKGRAVRMKCRKCAHVIEIPIPTSTKALQDPPASAPRPSRTKPSLKDTAARFSVSPSAPKPSKPMSPTAAAPLPPHPGTNKSPAPSATSAKLAPAAIARPSSKLAPPASTQREVPPNAPATKNETQAEPSALATAFTQKVSKQQANEVSAAIEVLSAGAGEEWYVGINGVPLGPVRLSTLRQKAAQGAVNEESLVWREGFEEWLPLRTFPELVALVREAREHGARTSFSPVPPQTHGISQRPSALSITPTPAPSAEVIGIAHTAEVPITSAVEKSASDAHTTNLATPEPRPSAAEKSEQAPGTVVASDAEALVALGHVTSDPFALAPTPTPTPAPGPTPASASVRVPPPAPLPSDLEEDVLVAAGVKRKSRMHLAAYLLIALAFGFGAALAVVFFIREEPTAPPPTIQVVTVTAPPAMAPGDTAAPTGSLALNESLKGKTSGQSNGRTTGLESTGDKKETSGGNSDNGPPPRVGLGHGPTIDGPSAGGPKSQSNLPQQLDQADIERVVNAHRGAVKRRCWERALRARDRKAPKSAKVHVSLTVAPSGNVSGASASGGTGYPGLASCVASSVRRWKFPASGGTSRATIPFAFFSQ